MTEDEVADLVRAAREDERAKVLMHLRSRLAGMEWGATKERITIGKIIIDLDGGKHREPARGGNGQCASSVESCDPASRVAKVRAQ